MHSPGQQHAGYHPENELLLKWHGHQLFGGSSELSAGPDQGSPDEVLLLPVQLQQLSYQLVMMRIRRSDRHGCHRYP